MLDQSPTQNEVERQTFIETAIREWAVTLKTTPDKLKEAIGAVGTSPNRVQAYLRQGSSSRPMA